MRPFYNAGNLYTSLFGCMVWSLTHRQRQSDPPQNSLTVTSQLDGPIPPPLPLAVKVPLASQVVPVNFILPAPHSKLLSCKEDCQKLLDGRNKKVPKPPSCHDIRYKQRSNEKSRIITHPALHNTIVGGQLNFDELPPIIESPNDKLPPVEELPTQVLITQGGGHGPHYSWRSHTLPRSWPPKINCCMLRWLLRAKRESLKPVGPSTAMICNLCKVAAYHCKQAIIFMLVNKMTDKKKHDAIEVEEVLYMSMLVRIVLLNRLSMETTHFLYSTTPYWLL